MTYARAAAVLIVIAAIPGAVAAAPAFPGGLDPAGAAPLAGPASRALSVLRAAPPHRVPAPPPAPGDLSFAVIAAEYVIEPAFSDTAGASTVAVAGRLTLEGRADFVDVVAFHLDEFVIDAVDDDIGPLTRTWAHDPAGGPGTLSVTLRDPLVVGAQTSFTVRYRGVPSCAPDPVRSHAGCRVEPAPSISWLHGPTVFPRKVAASDADGRDLFSLGINVVLPAGYHAAAPAEFDGEVDNFNGTVTSRWHHDQTDVVAAAFAKYAVARGDYPGAGAGMLQVASYTVSTEAGAHAQGYRDIAGDALRWFSTTYAPFGAPGFGFGEIASSSGAAVSLPLLALVPQAFLAYSPDQIGAAVTLSRLIARQWWGTGVRPADAGSLWLTEGLAGHSSLLYENARYGGAVPNYLSYFTYFHQLVYEYGVDRARDVPLSSPVIAGLDRDTYAALLHSKAPMVVRQLEGILGAKYPPLLRNFAVAHAGGWASTADFRAALEEAAGVPLAWYFDEWIDGTGFPVYTVSWDAVPKGYLYEITVNLFQENIVGGGPRFDMPVEFGIYTADAAAAPKKFGGRASDASEIFATTSVERPVNVVMDPEGKLPLKRVVSAVPGDLNVDMEVDGRDLLYVAWSYGDRFDDLIAGRGLFLGFADLTRDGMVDDGDLNLVLANFGACALSACAAQQGRPR